VTTAEKRPIIREGSEVTLGGRKRRGSRRVKLQVGEEVTDKARNVSGRRSQIKVTSYANEGNKKKGNNRTCHEVRRANQKRKGTGVFERGRGDSFHRWDGKAGKVPGEERSQMGRGARGEKNPFGVQT